jgi:hypothetical protein
MYNTSATASVNSLSGIVDMSLKHAGIGGETTHFSYHRDPKIQKKVAQITNQI